MNCPFRFTSFPKARPSPSFVHEVFKVFAIHELTISTLGLAKGLESDRVIQMIGPDSIVAPLRNIRFDHAAALWSLFYISLFTDNDMAMKRSAIAQRLEALRTLLPVDFFFAAYHAKDDDWKYTHIR